MLRRTLSLGGLVAAALAPAPAGAQEAYRIVDLTALAEPLGVVQSEARSVNAAGAIVGFEIEEAFIERAILWLPDGTVELLERTPGDNSNLVVTIEDDGTVLGVSEEVTFEPCGQITKIFEEQKATAWRRDRRFDLNAFVQDPGLEFDLRFAWDMNASRQVVGEGRSLEGPPYTAFGFLFDQGAVTDLGTLDHPTAINDGGQVVGYSGSGQDRAQLWEDGRLTDLHDDPAIGGVTSRAWAISEDGTRIAGEIQFDISKPEEPGAWLDGVATRLIPQVDRPQGAALAVGADGTIVGWYNDLDDLDGGFEGFRWRDGASEDLLDLLVDVDGWSQLFPYAVNERGWIVGGGFKDGRSGRAFLMVPLGD